MTSLRTINTSIPAHIAKETDTRLGQITDLFNTLVPEMTPPNNHRYQRNISPAIQEFIEAISFTQYLQSQTLISIEEVRARLPKEIGVSEEDYAMGLFDVTGEMMRFAITSLSTGHMASGGSKDGGPKLPGTQASLVGDLRAMRAAFEAISVSKRHDMFWEIGKKTEIMRTSVEKVERAAYGLLVRGSERPAGWMPDVSTMEVDTY